jgi:hypothetical protein
VVKDPEQGTPVRVEPNSELCKNYNPEELTQIPHISNNVKAALDFLGKASEGFFFMYEQGDVSVVIHYVCCHFASFNPQMHFVSLLILDRQVSSWESRK